MFSNSATECNREALHQQLDIMIQHLQVAARDGASAHKAEEYVRRQSRNLNHMMYGLFLKDVGPGDLGPTVTLEDGRTVQRWPEQQKRRVVNIFGEFTLSRHVYGTRPGQKIELAPTDQRLELPEGDISYLLQDWDQKLDAEHAFGTTSEMVEDIFGVKQSIDTLERGSRQMAEAAPAFRAAQPAPDPEGEGSLLVVSEDNKGVPMVRPLGSVPAGAHRKKGEKANKKQMACIGCVYSINPHIWTPEEVIAALFRDPDRKHSKRPEAVQKRYWAELSREEQGKTVRAQKEVFLHMATDIALRRKPDQVLVHLSDGQRSLETDRNSYLPRDANTVDILDLMHVLPRLWGAAHLFHAEGSTAASQFVRLRLPYVLAGNTAHVIAEFRQMGKEHGLRGAKAARMRRLCRFLEKNLYRMNYDEYLRAGYPIATGVIEGACRHVIKDRMERAGMRWTVPGAQAMLQLRTISANGDWEAFQAFRIGQENSRLYPHREAVDRLPRPIAA